MAAKQLPETDLLRQLLDYDPTTGVVRWRARPLDMFKPANGRSALNCQTVWNMRYAGSVAGSKRRYTILTVLGVGYSAHRIIWKMVHGVDPAAEIDHINRDKHDNRLSNLRDVSHSENMLNKPMYPNNTSGEKHIYWLGKMQRWTVMLNVPGVGRRQVAWLKNIKDAVMVRDALYEKYGYNA